ncbi:hypothetical protein [uncultured Tateyamaria sp.]|uniref:hypothetical protein n=1 Tax=uncultured Tateyamaria sp. TaxID=455651 RepID=UPI002611C418|nr:hypothetical protein [uncultured Tateyamaria sp.]
MPVSKVQFPFPIDGRAVPVFPKPIPIRWRDAAETKGFHLIARAKDRLHVVLACKICGKPTLKRISVVLGHNPECPHCITARRKAAAATVGAEFVARDPKGDRHYGVYRLACGHTDRRQHHRVEAAASGGHALSCEICLNERHAAEAEAQDWQLIGPSVRKNASYREYEHVCGHRQDVSVANMRSGDVDCAGCGESWTSKPSRLYILSFKLPGLDVIKLGFSSNPEFRMRQVQFDPTNTEGKVQRVVEIETGHRAICVEKALHSHIKAHRPDLIVPPELFRERIRTTSEIYHSHARSYISALLDAVEAGWDPTLHSISTSRTEPS